MILSLTGSGCATVPERAERVSRSVWIWEDETARILEDRRHRARVRGFLGSRGVDRVYLYADRLRDGRHVLRDLRAAYRRTVTELHRDGIRVYALLGSAALDTEEYVLPGKRQLAILMFQEVLSYNHLVPPASRFDGVNLDIEPHLNPEWKEDRKAVARLYLDLSAELMAMARDQAPELDVGPAIPFWYDGIEEVAWQGRAQPLHRHVQEIYDHVVLMDYRRKAHGPDGIVANASSELATGRELGKPVVVGVEVSEVEPSWISFREKGEAFMERELREAATSFADEPAFAGFAIHHLTPYRSWKREAER